MEGEGHTSKHRGCRERGMSTSIGDGGGGAYEQAQGMEEEGHVNKHGMEGEGYVSKHRGGVYNKQ